MSNLIAALLNGQDPSVPVAKPVAMTQQEARADPLPPKHHGTVDNILGFLGDFITRKLGMGTPYHDARENEKLNYARLMDMKYSPDTFQRVGDINPALAVNLQQHASDDRRLEASQQYTRELQEARLASQREKIRTDVKNRAAAYFNNLASNPDNIEERYAAGRQLWTNSKVVQNDPELAAELENLYPETFDTNMVASSISASVPVSTQWQQRLTANRDANNRQHQLAGERQAGINEQGRNARAAMQESGRNARAAAAESGRNNRAAAKNTTAAGGPPPPRFKGDVITSKSGKRMISPDGKTWKPA